MSLVYKTKKKIIIPSGSYWKDLIRYLEVSDIRYKELRGYIQFLLQTFRKENSFKFPTPGA
jgi:hypothetical protein